MPSLISAYEYDVFISYRQNHNRFRLAIGVSKNLQEVTINEAVFVYFVSNRHDGSHETPEVDDSRKYTFVLRTDVLHARFLVMSIWYSHSQQTAC